MPAKIVVDPSRPLLEGGLGPGAGSAYMQHRLTDAARGHGIDISNHSTSFPSGARRMLLDGGDGFPGVLTILDETFEEAGEAYREWLHRIHVACALRVLPKGRACGPAVSPWK